MSRYCALQGVYLRSERPRVVLLAALLIGSIGLQLAAPQVVRYFIDTTQRGESGPVLLLAALLFMALSLGQRAVALAAVYVGENVGWAATNALRADLTRHCLRLDMPFHKAHTPGELIERVDGDASALGNFFSQFVIRVLGNALLVVGILALLFREDWRIGLGLSIYALLVLAALGALQKIAVGAWAESRRAQTEHYGFIEERITGGEDIRANGAEPYVLRRLYELMRDLLVQERRAMLLSNLTYVSTNFLFVAGYALGLGLGAYLYTRGDVTIGTAYLVIFYIGMLAAPLENIREQAQDLHRATASIDRVQELFRERPYVQQHSSAMLPEGALDVELDHVSFGYETDDRVLRDVSFRLEPGQVLGLLGRTGSGKTTLTRLLFRLYDPRDGAIRLGGVRIDALGLDDLRAHVGMVTQDVQLFGASVRDNLTFFNRRLGDEQLEAALHELGLGEWLRGLPAGLDTPLGAGGYGLSAGEAQLLAFARVLLKNPGLVVLDEASSRLDPASERLLERAVGRLLRPEGTRRTGIIIAHRLETVFRADVIMILEDGQVVEYGPRERLAGDPSSRFFALLRTGLEETLL
ncbi:MAG TPA: ABC transporter ATP-binding protein [Herpetosiphonaceae bacterium]|nr:ABC transporter ATP-binding protein [Herpetosiphonaceae bacterium]